MFQSAPGYPSFGSEPWRSSGCIVSIHSRCLGPWQDVFGSLHHCGVEGEDMVAPGVNFVLLSRPWFDGMGADDK